MNLEGVRRSGTGGSDDRELDQGEIHDVLRNTRRRLVLERLRETEGPETVRDLSEYIAGVESGETPAPRNVRQSVYVSLHQTHLPKLDDLGIVTYDSNAKEVSLAERADELAVYMEVVQKYGISWGEFYIGVATLGLLLLLAGGIGVPLVRSVDAGLIGGFFLALILVSATYHITAQRSSLLHRLRDR
jgi:predicted transcriptional regulator